MWIEIKVKPILKGEMYFVCQFQYKEDALKFESLLRDRFHKYGMELAEEKTRLIEFGRYANENAKNRGEKNAKTFNFLGFSFYCSTDSQQRKGYDEQRQAYKENKIFEEMVKIILNCKSNSSFGPC